MELDLFLNLAASVFLGGIIGFERDYFGKAAGARTHSLVSLGACLIMIVSVKMVSYAGDGINIDPSRIAAQVVSGIGFIGAGAIIQSGASVRGITTAASLWICAAIGLCCGLGKFAIAGFSTLLVLVILFVLPQAERLFIKVIGMKRESVDKDQ